MNVTDINPLTLPSLPLSDRLKLPNLSAIYFVISNGQVIYNSFEYKIKRSVKLESHAIARALRSGRCLYAIKSRAWRLDIHTAV
ncbi:hypothetical protein NIES4071_109360 (plasmid) [Calothrix sp. NIES-4071]|nr:hypothetical protein NIES4071_109360 [Calothrix sp. NIES-4071]BAZ65199.1 hypothetical protein NIES4105_109320 [Calothrix sp. NIES-4105]